jgi:hypothetical protein
MDSVEFLHSVWSPQGQGYAILSFKDRDDGSWRDLAFEFPDEEIELPSRKLGDIYFCPNLFIVGRRRRGMVKPSCWLYADLDTVEPVHVAAELSPTVAWESSPGRYQALWHLDRHLDEDEHSEVNKKLTYAIGADKSGWDITQVLRVPGTVNHKYSSRPEVKLLWSDEIPEEDRADEYFASQLSEVEVSVPSGGMGENGTPSVLSSREILRSYGSVIPRGVRGRLRAIVPIGER